MAHYTGSVHITLSNTEGHERELSEYVLGFIEENKIGGFGSGDCLLW